MTSDTCNCGKPGTVRYICGEPTDYAACDACHEAVFNEAVRRLAIKLRGREPELADMLPDFAAEHHPTREN